MQEVTRKSVRFMELEMPERVEVHGICSMLHGRGYEAYLVGGCVRDLMLGRIPKDIDFVTNADPDTVEKIFTGAADRVLTVGKSFGVVVVVTARRWIHRSSLHRASKGSNSAKKSRGGKRTHSHAGSTSRLTKLSA